MAPKMIYKCVACPYTADKRYSMKRHYAGKTFKVPHTDADFEASSVGVVVDDDAEPVDDAPDDEAPALASGPTSLATDVVTEIVESPALRAMLLEALALKAATEPVAPFCEEPAACIRAMEDGVRLWRAAVSSPTSTDGLVDLLVRKHLRAFRNVRAASDDGAVSVARRGGVWETVPATKAAEEAIAAAARDVRVLREADSVGGDASYLRFGALMDVFVSSIGAQLGWGDGAAAKPGVLEAVATMLAGRLTAGAAAV